MLGIGMFITTSRANTTGPSPAEGGASVSGAGSPGVDGLYTHRGTFNGKKYYNLDGEPDNSGRSSIFWDAGQWALTSSGGDPLYVGVEDVELPWEVSLWELDAGDAPAPTVTEA